MRNRRWMLATLASFLFVMGLLSACNAEPTPVVKAPSLSSTSGAQLPTLLPTRLSLTATPVADRTAVVQRGTIRTGVNASGKLSPDKSIKLSFAVPGVVKDILVTEGQPVKAGDVLARLDTTDLEQALQAAQQDLANRQLSYSLTITPTRADVATARAALDSANANLAYLQSLPNPKQVEIARLQLDNTKRDPQYSIAKLQYEIAAQGATPAQLAAATAQVAQAQAQLDKLLVTDDRQRKLAEAQLQQAEQAVQTAQERLDSAQLKSPIDGVVASLPLELGDHVGSSPAAVVIDPSTFDVVLSADEVSVGQLALQQPATVVIAAFPDRALTGHIKSIAAVPTQAGDASGYRTVIALDKTDASLRNGMSADVAIIVGEHDNVLIIPAWAMRTDRATSKNYAYVKRGDQTQETEIEIGLYDASQVEVKSGLTEGEVVVAPPKTTP